MTSAHPVHSEVAPSLVQVFSRHSAAGQCEFYVSASIPSLQHLQYGAPDTVWLHLSMHPELASADSTTLEFDILWCNKTRTRLAEASWFAFSPAVIAASTGWRLHGFERCGLPEGCPNVDPTDVVQHGATHLHTLGPFAEARYSGPDGDFVIVSLDAPIVSMGVLSPFPTPGDNATIAQRMSSGLFYNVSAAEPYSADLVRCLHDRFVREIMCAATK